MHPSADKRMKIKAACRVAVVALALVLGVLPQVGAKVPGEYDVKAAFLYNFIAFTEWPAEAFDSPASPVVIGVLGKDPFGSSLEAMMSGERVKDRPLVVWRAARIEDLKRCHILFISSSEAKQLGEILSRLKTRPILTVSDIAGFAEAGGAVGFSTTGSVKLTVNPAALQTARLTLSAKLLRLARVLAQNSPLP